MVEPSPDIVIVGSGMGGATLAHGLADSGARILILERGEQLQDSPQTRDAKAIFQDGFFRTGETWLDGQGRTFSPGNYYMVGGNTKFYGAVLIRFRAEDFKAMAHAGGLSPAWPFGYEEIEPYYTRAEALYRVRGQGGQDPTEAPRTAPYPFPPLADEPAVAVVRERLRKAGLKPFSLPLGIDIDTWLARAPTTWDAFPDTRTGKMDAENCALADALARPNVRMATGARVRRLIAAPDGKRIAAVEFEQGGETKRMSPKLVVLAAGAVNSAALLLASANDDQPGGLANRSGQVGRNFMNHNCSAMLSIDPRLKNDAVHQKTFGLNDFYLDDGKGGPPLGNVQLLGKVTAPILKAQMRRAPNALCTWITNRSFDWYLMSEDLPDPDSRVTVDSAGRITLDWRRSNMAAHAGLVRRMRQVFRRAGFPIVLSRAFDRRTPSHQCGTVRLGDDPSTAPLDPYCRAFDHDNLFVVDASFLVSSAAVNPALTVAAQALRVADHIKRTDLAA